MHNSGIFRLAFQSCHLGFRTHVAFRAFHSFSVSTKFEFTAQLTMESHYLCCKRRLNCSFIGQLNLLIIGRRCNYVIRSDVTSKIARRTSNDLVQQSIFTFFVLSSALLSARFHHLTSASNIIDLLYYQYS